MWLVESVGEKLKRLPLSAIETAVIQESPSLTFDFLKALWAHGVPVTILKPAGDVLVQTTGTKSEAKATLWRRQLGFVTTQVAYEMAANWLQQQQLERAELLRQYGHSSAGELKRLAVSYVDAVSFGGGQEIGGTLGEGHASRLYWKAFGSLLPMDLDWPNRQQRGANDVVNQALNYGYGVLYGLIRSRVVKKGLHAGLGIFHSEGKGGDALVFDMIEPLRPYVEDVVLSLSLKHELRNASSGDTNGLSFRVRRALAKRVLERLEAPCFVDRNGTTPIKIWESFLSTLVKAIRATPRNLGYAQLS